MHCACSLRYLLLTALGRQESSTMSLPKVKDVEKESTYGYVYGVSGPGWCIVVIQRIARYFLSCKY